MEADIDPSTITPEMLGTLLLNIFCPKTEVIKESTKILKKYFELHSCLGPLLSYATASTDDRIRLLACICLRKKLVNHWIVQDTSFKSTMKEVLLKAFVSETVPKVRENISYVIGVLAFLLIPNNEWPELFTIILSKCQNPDPNELQQGMLLLYAVCDCLDKDLEPLINSTVELLSKLINAKGCLILIVKTVNAMMKSGISEESLTKVATLLPELVKVAISSPNNDSLLHDIFDSLSDLVVTPKVLTPYLPMLIEVAISIAENKDDSKELRTVVLMFVDSVIDSKPKIVKEDKSILVRILNVGFEVAKEEKGDDNEDSPASAAIDLIERCALKIANKIVYPMIIERCENFMKSTEPQARSAALIILGASSKGIETPLKKNLESIIDVILQYVKDPSMEVQEACLITLCYFADYISSSFVKYHSKVLPSLLSEIENKPDKLKARILIALEIFCKNLEKEEIVQYLKPLLQLLVLYLNNPITY